jgi:membrane associated rhomboid family serine protease
VRFLPIALISSLVVYKTADWFGLFLTQATRTTTLWSLAGYPFLVIGLWNASLLFRLSRPNALLPAIAVALVADLVFGYAMSRTVSYQMAVFGFTVGSVLFGSISSLQVIRRLESLDYYYFSSAV